MPDVLLEKARDYPWAAQLVPELLDRVLPDISGASVLLKPNFVAQRGENLCCTHPAIITAAARHCVQRGARVRVGDSPAFGTAQAIARATGLAEMLRPLGVSVITLGRARRVKSGGVTVPVSADALDADLIVNLPKFKAHSQMRFTGAVKNLFGCVTGVRKAWLHALHGDKGTRFAEMIRGLTDVLPQTVHLMDGVVAMHRTGPIAGEPFKLELLGASAHGAALDAAAGMVLGEAPDRLPVWGACLRAGMAGADAAEIAFPRLGPDDFDASGFILPDTLKPESFRPDVLVRSLVRRVWLSRAGS